MHKFSFSFFLFVILPFSSSYSQAIEFQERYDYEAGYDECISLEPTSDGGYILAGSATDSVNLRDVYLVKVDVNGDISWTKTFGGASYDYANSVMQTSDGGFIVAGSTQSFPMSVNENMYLIKTDASGNMLWSKTYGGASHDIAYDVKQTSDNGYIIAGYTDSYPNPRYSYIIKTDSSGNILWTNAFRGAFLAIAYSVIQTSDGDYLATGQIASAVGIRSAFLIKMDVNGNTLWIKTFELNNNEEPYAVKQTLDGGYILTGRTSSGTNQEEIFLTKTDSAGNPVWTKIYDGINPLMGKAVEQTSDGGYIVGGWSEAFSNVDAYVIKTNSIGDTLWTKSYGGPNNEYLYALKKTADGGFVLGGYKYVNPGNTDMYLIKTDMNGNSGCDQSNTDIIVTSPAMLPTSFAIFTSTGSASSNPATNVGNGGVATILCSNVGIPETDIANTISVYPDPFNSVITVIADETKQSQLKIYNVLGEIIYQSKIQNPKTEIDLSTIPSGVYFITIKNDQGIVKRKIIKT